MILAYTRDGMKEYSNYKEYFFELAKERNFDITLYELETIMSMLKEVDENDSNNSV